VPRAQWFRHAIPVRAQASFADGPRRGKAPSLIRRLLWRRRSYQVFQGREGLWITNIDPLNSAISLLGKILKQAGAGFAAGADERRYLFVGDGRPHPDPTWAKPRHRRRYRARIWRSAPKLSGTSRWCALRRRNQNHREPDVGWHENRRQRRSFQKTRHVIAADEVQWSGLHGFNRSRMGAAGDDRLQAENFAGMGDDAHKKVLPSREVVEGLARP
jgi:hypothetical protein